MLVILALIIDDDASRQVEQVEEPPKKKRRKSPKVWEGPWLARRLDPACENLFTLMCQLREVSMSFHVSKAIFLTIKRYVACKACKAPN